MISETFKMFHLSVSIPKIVQYCAGSSRSCGKQLLVRISAIDVLKCDSAPAALISLYVASAGRCLFGTYNSISA